MVIVCPLYFCASFTARSAALSACAPVAADMAKAVKASIEAHFASKPIGNSSLWSPALSAMSGTQPLEALLESLVIQNVTIDDAARHPAMLDVEHGTDVGRAIVGEALVRPAQRVWR